MRRELRFLCYTILVNLRNRAELRSSFLMLLFGMAINNVSFIVLWIAFVDAVGEIGGWTAMDIVGLQGFTALSFGIAFSAGAGLRRLPELVAGGGFDSLLLSPRNLLLRVATSSFSVASLGDVVFGVVCLAVFGHAVGLGLGGFGAMVYLVACGVAVMAATAIVCAAAGFLFAEPTLVANSLFEFFLTPALFHGGAFQGGLRAFFTFAVPALVVGTLPVEAIRQDSPDILLLVGAVSASWLAASILLFHRAVRKYESTNFMTFGGT